MPYEKLSEIQNQLQKYRELIDVYQNWRYVSGLPDTDWDFLIFYIQEEAKPENDHKQTGEGCKFFPDREPEKFRADFKTGGSAPTNFRTDCRFEVDLIEKLENAEVEENQTIEIEDKIFYTGGFRSCGGCEEKLEKGDQVERHEPFGFILTHVDCSKKFEMVRGLG